ncbi:MAG: hypothetical protein KIS83_08610 [Rubrivivax sp.]|nr:hypothetical protein [Rubrivivax sp.]
MRPAPPGRAGFAGPPGHGVEVGDAALGLQLPFGGAAAARPARAAQALQRRGQLGGRRAAGQAHAGQHQPPVVGLALHRHAHRQRRAFQATGQLELPARLGRRHCAGGRRVGRGQAAQRGRQRAGQRHRRGAAVQPLRQQVGDLGGQRQLVALPQRAAADAPGGRAGIGQQQLEARGLDAVALGELAAQLQRQAAQRQPGLVPAPGQQVLQHHAGRQRRVGSAAAQFGAAVEPRLRRLRRQRGEVQRLRLGIERAQRPGREGAQLGAQVGLGRRTAAARHAAQRGLHVHARQLAAGPQRRRPGRRVAGGQRHHAGLQLQRQRRAVAQPALRGERQALPLGRGAPERESALGPRVDRQPLELQRAQRRLRADLQLAELGARQRQRQRQP